jgi:GNAT superfamily N-acetyltransferase
VDEWDERRLPDLTALVDAALPSEGLLAEELSACCLEADEGVVLATPDGDGAISAVVRRYGDHAVGYVNLLAVVPRAQRTGVGSALLAAAETWLFDRGVFEVQLAGAPPFYLWPGVDTAMLSMLCLAEAREFESFACELNMGIPTTFRAKPPDGVVLRRVLEPDDLDATVAFIDGTWPWWVPEAMRGIEQGACIGAWRDDAVVGFACHSVNRTAWIGPMGTDPRVRSGGVGHALLGELCRDLMVAHHTAAEICWVGPVRFYAKAGAGVSRTFRLFRKRRG